MLLSNLLKFMRKFPVSSVRYPLLWVLLWVLFYFNYNSVFLPLGFMSYNVLFILVFTCFSLFIYFIL